ncbi:MAG: hypothetical protein Kow0010_18870 [Dehalococcoidia bacterium]
MTTSSFVSLVAPQLLEAAADLRGPAVIAVGLPPLIAQRLADEGLPALRRRATVVWERPDQGIALFGFGRAVAIRGHRDSPIDEAAAAIRRIADRARLIDVPPGARPRFFGGGRFAPGGRVHDAAWDAFGGWAFIIPRLLLAITPDGPTATFTHHFGPATGDDPDAILDAVLATALAGRATTLPSLPGHATAVDRTAWETMVEAALDRIAGDHHRKIVLARCAIATGNEPFDVGRALSRLAERYGSCFVFALRDKAGTWLGASPELLCSLNGGAVQAASLAGSKPRGRDDATDRQLARDLWESEKERTEHALVASAISEALGPLCDDLVVPETPMIMRMANIQHLYTPITGRLHDALDVMDVVQALHPTPAVGGWPKADALEAIEAIEHMDRGWYAGPIGWADLQGDGEFAVALRVALVGGREARLYAGAGIVAGSEPPVEYAETETKLCPLRDALGVEPGP